jgi:hypothetical protein
MLAHVHFSQASYRDEELIFPHEFAAESMMHLLSHHTHERMGKSLRHLFMIITFDVRKSTVG